MELGGRDGFAGGVASDDLDFTCVVLSALGDVKVVHAVIRQLVALALKNGFSNQNKERKKFFLKQTLTTV